MALVAQRRRVLLLAALVGTLTCACGEEATRAALPLDAAPAALADAAPPSRAERLARTLREADAAGRTAAIAEVGALSVRGELAPADGVALLAAIAAMPPVEQAPAVEAVFLRPRAAYGPSLDALAPPARAAALARLAGADDPAADVEILRLLAAHPDEPQPALFVALARRPRPALFPALVTLLEHPALAAGIVDATNAACARRAVRPRHLAPVAPAVIARWHELRDTLPHSLAAALDTLELMGCLPRKTVDKELRAAAAHADPDVALAAVRAMVLAGARPPKAALEAVAARPETRARLFETVVGAGKKRLFPKKWRDQARLAESVLVAWLREPEHLGQAPDAIELVDVVAVDVGKPEGVLDHYVFRFTRGDKEMIGVAGPFRRKKAPTIEDLGATGSDLRPARRRKPKDLVDAKDVKAWWKAEREEVESQIEDR